MGSFYPGSMANFPDGVKMKPMKTSDPQILVKWLGEMCHIESKLSGHVSWGTLMAVGRLFPDFYGRIYDDNGESGKEPLIAYFENDHGDIFAEYLKYVKIYLADKASLK